MLKTRMNKGKTRISAGFSLAEMEGFEPSRHFRTLLPEQGSPFTTWVHLQGLRITVGGVGGEDGIRTHGSDESPVFKTGSLNRSDTSPRLYIVLQYIIISGGGSSSGNWIIFVRRG